MVFAGCEELRHFLNKHTTRAAIESHARSVRVIEVNTFFCLKEISIDTQADLTFFFKTLTPDSVPRQTENEVAAIKYVRARTSKIPTPEVIAYSTVPGNEWIAHEKVKGVKLSDAWSTYSEERKWQTLQTVADLYKLFAAITSLDAFGATQIGGLNLDMTLGETVESAKGYGRQSIKGYHKGPYKDVTEYLSSYIDKEIQYYSTSSDVDMQIFDYDESDDEYEDDSTAPSSYGTLSCPDSLLADDEYEEISVDFSSYVHIPTREEELQRLKNRDDFILYLRDVQRFVVSRVDKRELPCLTHNNLHAQNIIVNDEGEIVALYNWEFAGFYPLSLTFEAPRMEDENTRHEHDVEGRDWCEAFCELFGTVKEVHPLVASVLEPMNPLLTNAWEE